MGPGEPRLPHVIVVTDGVVASPTDPIVTADGIQGVTVIDMPARWGDLESAATTRIAFAPDGSDTAEILSHAHAPVAVEADTMSQAEAEATARRLLPLHIPVTADVEPGTTASAEQQEPCRPAGTARRA
ncbi:hypothetical protein [Demequina litorisediminis]|uniref:Uncharacterized protein n=1 Tax=Demequina litorisediminis TaxID=1849022 RepID=A0ABQ6IEQ5_9MICO|nr:hypothetical protein [Demequina litorisediminis]GMA36199.1 hypothetical protein GCM10025876_24030 [Demequina litorisediminis]